MADFKQLKAQLMSLQQAPIKPRLSERNIVEVVQKLINSQGLTLYFSSNGKEFLTPDQLEAEIVAEVRRAGRVSLVDLPGILGVNIEFVEKHTAMLVAKRKDFLMIDGSVMSELHMDVLAHEVDTLIALSGQVQISELARKFSLPSDFLRSHLSKREGTILHGKVKDAQIVTDVYLLRHYARLRGTLRGCTEPTSLKGFDQSLVAGQVAEMIQKREVRGSVSGIVFTPSVYTESIASNLQTLYKSSLLIDYDTVKRIAKLQTTAEAKKMINTVVPGGKHLETCYMDEGMMAALKGEIANALTIRKVVKCREHLELPSAIHYTDLTHLIGDSPGIFLFEDTIWSESAIQEIAATFEPVVKRIAEELKVAANAPQPAKGAKKKSRGDAFSSVEVINHLKKARCLEKYQLSDLEGGYEALASRLHGKVLEMIEEAKERARPAVISSRKKETIGVDLFEEFSVLQLYVKAIGVISGKYPNINPLQVHLSKTVLPVFYVNLLKVQMKNQGLPSADDLKFSDRAQILSAFPEYLQQIFLRLSDCIRERKLEEFVSFLLEVKQDLPAVTIQALDKKKERAFLHKQRLICKENLTQALAGSDVMAISYHALVLRLVDVAGVLVCIPAENWAVQTAIGVFEVFAGGVDDTTRAIHLALENPGPEALSPLKESLLVLLN